MRTKIVVITIVAVLFLTLGVAFIVSGFIGPTVIDNKISAGIRDAVVVSSTESTAYKSWKRNDQDAHAAPLYLKFYLFNIKNVEQVIAGTAKPVLEQMGPYSYRKYQSKFNITFPSGGSEVSFKTQNYYVFDVATSKGRPSDTVTTVNIPFQGVQQTFGRKWYQQLAFDLFASSTSAEAFVKKTVQELCWGYTDPMLKAISYSTPSVSSTFGLQTNYTSESMANKMTEMTIMKTGLSNIKDIKQYIKWEGRTKLRFWGTPEANTIKGTDGTQFHPGIDPDESLLVFVDNAYRTASIVKTDVSHIYGIELYRFSLADTMLLNASSHPTNAAFYQLGPSGVTNLTAPTGIPLYLSKPHFLDADSYYLNGVTGLVPDKKTHDTFIDVEPITGLVLNAAKRLQINVKLQDVIMLYENLPDVYIPVGWIEESSHVTEEMANEIQKMVVTPTGLTLIIKYIGWIGGSILFMTGVILFIMLGYYKRNVSPVYLPVPDEADSSLYNEKPEKPA